MESFFRIEAADFFEFVGFVASQPARQVLDRVPVV
jgi:hypothetical protein